jgi:hypothetical protein
MPFDPKKLEAAKARLAAKAATAAPMPSAQPPAAPSQDELLSSDQQFGPEASRRTVEALTSPTAMSLGAGLAAAPFTEGMSLLPQIATMGAVQGGAALAGQKLRGEETDLLKAGKEAGKGALWQGVFGAPVAAYQGVRSYIANSPRILDKLAKFAATTVKRDIKAPTILEAIQREGVPAKMESVERATEKIKFSSDKATANLAMTEKKKAEEIGVNALNRAQQRLKNQRIYYGKQIEKADNELVSLAKSKQVWPGGMNANSISLDDISKKAFLDYYEPIRSNPILKDSVSLGKLESTLANMASKPTITIEEAIQAKRLIPKIFEDFSNKGVMAVKDIDTLTLAMKSIRQGLDKALKQKAKDLGASNYATAYKKFGKFADDYDSEFLPMFGAKEGKMASAARFNSLTGLVNSGDLRLEVVKHIKDFIPKDSHGGVTAKVIDDMTDYLVLSSLYKDLGSAPSSTVVGYLRLGMEPAIKNLAKIRAPGGMPSNVPSYLSPFGVQITKE